MSFGRYMTALITWSCLAALLVIIFVVGPYFYDPTLPQYPPLASALYASLSPVLWSGCLFGLTASFTLGENSKSSVAL